MFVGVWWDFLYGIICFDNDRTLKKYLALPIFLIHRITFMKYTYSINYQTYRDTNKQCFKENWLWIKSTLDPVFPHNLHLSADESALPFPRNPHPTQKTHTNIIKNGRVTCQSYIGDKGEWTIESETLQQWAIAWLTCYPILITSLRCWAVAQQANNIELVVAPYSTIITINLSQGRGDIEVFMATTLSSHASKLLHQKRLIVEEIERNEVWEIRDEKFLQRLKKLGKLKVVWCFS